MYFSRCNKCLCSMLKSMARALLCTAGCLTKAILTNYTFSLLVQEELTLTAPSGNLQFLC